MEGALARRDALVVADPPRSMLATAGRGARVERGAGDPYRWLEAELPGLGYEQDLVHAAVRQGEGGDPHPAGVVDRQVGLEVRRAVRGRRAHRLAPRPAAVTGRDHHDVRVGTLPALGKRHVEIALCGNRDGRAAVGHDVTG